MASKVEFSMPSEPHHLDRTVTLFFTTYPSGTSMPRPGFVHVYVNFEYTSRDVWMYKYQHSPSSFLPQFLHREPIIIKSQTGNTGSPLGPFHSCILAPWRHYPAPYHTGRPPLSLRSQPPLSPALSFTPLSPDRRASNVSSDRSEREPNLAASHTERAA